MSCVSHRCKFWAPADSPADTCNSSSSWKVCQRGLECRSLGSGGGGDAEEEAEQETGGGKGA